MSKRHAVAALVLACFTLPAWAQIGPPDASQGQSWTGQAIGNQQHWRNEQGQTWRTMPLGDKQQLVISPDGRSQVCVRTGAITHCR